MPKLTSKRKCWNWQTGMTKDHVIDDREGSSPFFRRKSGYSSLVEHQLPKLDRRVRFPLSA